MFYKKDIILKVVVLIATFIFQSFYVISQHKKLSLELDSTFIIESSYYNRRDKIKFSQYNGNEIFFFKENVKDSLNIIFFNGNPTIFIKDSNLKNKRIKEIILTSKEIVISTFQKLYIYSRFNSSTILKDSLIHNYDRVKYFGDSLLFFYNNYNFHPLDCPSEQRSRFGVFSLNKMEFLTEKNNTFNYYYYTHLISKFIDVSPSKKNIAFSNTLPYNIKIFNSNLALIDSINHTINFDKKKLDDIDKFLDTIITINGSIKNVIFKASKNDKNVDRIIKIYYLNDTTLMVVKKMSESNKNIKERNIDIWQKKIDSNKWKLIVDNQSYFSSLIFINEDSTMNIHVPFRHSNQILSDGNYYYVISSYIPYNSFKNYNEMVNYQKSINRENVFYGIYRFKYEIK